MASSKESENENMMGDQSSRTPAVRREIEEVPRNDLEEVFSRQNRLDPEERMNDQLSRILLDLLSRGPNYMRPILNS